MMISVDVADRNSLLNEIGDYDDSSSAELADICGGLSPIIAMSYIKIRQIDSGTRFYGRISAQVA